MKLCRHRRKAAHFCDDGVRGQTTSRENRIWRALVAAMYRYNGPMGAYNAAPGASVAGCKLRSHRLRFACGALNPGRNAFARRCHPARGCGWVYRSAGATSIAELVCHLSRESRENQPRSNFLAPGRRILFSVTSRASPFLRLPGRPWFARGQFLDASSPLSGWGLRRTYILWLFDVTY